jgi:hypothetical protein
VTACPRAALTSLAPGGQQEALQSDTLGQLRRFYTTGGHETAQHLNGHYPLCRRHTMAAPASYR